MRKKITGTFRLMVLVTTMLTLGSCGAYLHQPMQSSRARIGEVAQTNHLLKDLPKAQQKIIAAVYKFQDQTGQYKPSDNGGSFSTAVTQGGTTILMRALEDSGWFVPIERENISNLLNERKLIRSSHMQYNGGNGNNAVPPLLFAGILLEGGIVSYDANVITGGAGLRYFGVGSSGQYRQDRVTVYLRAISTNSGKVLKTVYTSKTILSQTVDVGVFRFVSFKRLLEFETGFTSTEPGEQAVTEAIEKAVQIMVLEGMEEGLWQAENPAKAEVAIKNYQKEKAEMNATDLNGRRPEVQRSKSSLGIQLTGNLYVGDFGNSTVKPGIDVSYSYLANPWWSISASAGYGTLGTKEFFNSKATYLDLSGQYRFLPFDKVTPYITSGFGLLVTEDAAGDFNLTKKSQLKFNMGFGMEYMVQKNTGLDISVNYNYPFNDRLDNTDHGKFNDYYWQIKGGVRLYFGQKPPEGRWLKRGE